MRFGTQPVTVMVHVPCGINSDGVSACSSPWAASQTTVPVHERSELQGVCRLVIWDTARSHYKAVNDGESRFIKIAISSHNSVWVQCDLGHFLFGWRRMLGFELITFRSLAQTFNQDFLMKIRFRENRFLLNSMSASVLYD